MSKKKWKVFVMCHNVIWDSMYSGDPDFSAEHYTFLKLGSHDLKYNRKKGYEIISEFDFSKHLTMPHYAEFTGMYCVFKNKLHEGLDYIGFSHYDKEHRLVGSGENTPIQALEQARHLAEVKRKGRGVTNITNLVDNTITESDSCVHICLEGHDFDKIYNQRVLMDESNPDLFVGEGVNCIDRILEDYNAFFDTHYTKEDIARDGYLNMCDCFVTPVYLFDKLMSFLTPIIESGKLDIFDSLRKHRLQGGLLERYAAVFFALEKIEKTDLSTVHQYWNKKGVKENKLKKLFKKCFN